MKNIAINPFVLVLALLGSFGLGALLTASLSRKFDQGYHAAHMASQRDAARAISILMTEGVVVRRDDGSSLQFVLQPVAKPAPNSGE